MPARLHARRRWPPTTETLFVAAIALLGLRIGLRPIGDNSAFVHIRTGIEMVAGHGIPRRDPYSFTALDQRWIVQSWLPELTYGVLHKLGGYRAIVLEDGALYGVLAGVIACLARTARPLRTAGAASAAVAIGAGYWAPRPLAFGLAAFALVVLVVERQHSPWWLVPIGWVWVNSHGSFPLGLLWLVAVVGGEALDKRAWPTTSARYASCFAVGLLLGAVNPLGPRLLVFPLTLLGHREVLGRVIEWQSPNFRDGRGFLSLAGIATVVVLLGRARGRWADVVPVGMFLALGLIAQRNLPLLGVVAAAPLARALVGGRSDAAITIEGDRAGPNAVFVGAIGLAGLLFVVGTLRSPGLDVEGYPVGATRWLQLTGLLSPPVRVVAQDITGGYLILERGRSTPVFIDDRVDMYPSAISSDYQILLEGRPGVDGVLDRWRADVVLWEAKRPLATILARESGWRIVYDADGWRVFVRG